MIDTRTDTFVTADTLEELYEKVPEDFRGPIFKTGELLEIRGYYFRVDGADEFGLQLSISGPAPARAERRSKRRR